MNTLLIVAGVIQLGIVTAAVELPRRLQWSTELMKVDPVTRLLVRAHIGFIALIIGGFGVVTIVAADELALGSPLARTLCGLIAAFWFTRLGLTPDLHVQPLLIDAWIRFLYRALTGCVVLLAVVYALAAVGPALAPMRIAVALAGVLIVPLALRLINGDDAPLRWARAGLRSGGAMLALAMFLPVGWIAGLLALPWLAITAALAAAGLGRLVRGEGPAGHTLGLLLIPVGGVWATVAALGIEPFGFAEPIVTLTAVHFHYAGFALAVIVGSMASANTRRFDRVTTTALAISMAAITAGFVSFRALELIGAAGVMAVVIVVAVRLLRRSVRPGIDRRSRMALVFAAASGVSAVGPAAVYAVGWFVGVEWIAIDVVAVTHGVAMGCGFVPGALVGLGWMRQSGVACARGPERPRALGVRYGT